MATDTPEWQALAAHLPVVRALHLRTLFETDPRRAERMSLEAAGIHIDWSKHLVTDETVGLLLALARRADVMSAAGRMFAGERINVTEGRAVLHTALRNRSGGSVSVDGRDVMPDVRDVLRRMGEFTHAVRSGSWRGCTGRPVRDIVNIGIGGSHLGPDLACDALRPYVQPGLRLHFVSNIDATDIASVLATCDPESVLVIVASKTFTTQETMTNARTARDWFLRTVGDEAAVARHFVAVSTNLDATRAFGIEDRNVFEFWDWVGGRYSLWSAIGLPIALGIGMERFEELLGGAYAMDRHFLDSPPERNAPLLLALLGIWYADFLGAQSHAVIPYDQHLRLLPPYLQQLDMESNGKQTRLDGSAVTCGTGPVVWGATGTNGQHAFFQLLHQGTRLVPIDFIAPLTSQHPLPPHHDMLLANCFAQSEALMRGRTAAEARAEMEAAGLAAERIAALLPHRVFPGNRPSTTLLVERLTPHALGALIALYEHKVFVQGRVWNVNSFDQWGVELGKQLADRILRDIHGGTDATHDCSTAALIARYRAARAAH